MTDEDQFRATLDDVRELPCAFQKAILNRQADCNLVERFNLGERECVRCTDYNAARNCQALLALFREKGRFALGERAIPGALPHAKELRLQVGGLQGLACALDPAARPPVRDIHGVTRRAQDAYGSLRNLPFETVAQGISRFSGRRRRSGRRT